MAKILKNIDKIAREKQRDVYLIQFDKKTFPRFNYKEYENRAELLEWMIKTINQSYKLEN